MYFYTTAIINFLRNLDEFSWKILKSFQKIKEIINLMFLEKNVSIILRNSAPTCLKAFFPTDTPQNSLSILTSKKQPKITVATTEHLR